MVEEVLSVKPGSANPRSNSDRGNVGAVKHEFSVEMKSKRYVKSISISDRTPNRVLFEGCLGGLEELSIIEGEALEVKGEYGVLRIELSEEELREALGKPRASLT